jgi:S1-C subfamily serine protease
MTNPDEGTNPLAALSTAMADAVERVAASVVLVNARPGRPISGVVTGPDLVLTVDHVLEQEGVTVRTHDGRQLPAALAGRDPEHDLALLRVAGLGLEPARPAGPPRVGQLALAVARPSGEGVMASSGIVSAVGGAGRGRAAVPEGYLRTDATPYPGFSGGAVADAGGAVLGITNAGLVRGVAMAVAAEVAWRAAETLAARGSIPRAYLGVSGQPVRLPPGQRAGRPEEGGLLILRVEASSPAERAGLLLGDVVLSFDGRPVRDAGDIQSLLTGDRVGRTVALEVLRAGALQTLQATVGQRDAGRGA